MNHRCATCRTLCDGELVGGMCEYCSRCRENNTKPPTKIHGGPRTQPCPHCGGAGKITKHPDTGEPLQ